MRVTVVGAGLGGLAAALRLARAGYSVEVVEKRGSPGGKLCEVHQRSPSGAFRFDAGPTLVTMPHLLEELFETCGERLSDHLRLSPVTPSCRYRWTDGTVIDEDERLWSRTDVARYLEHARGVYDLSADTFLDRAPAEMWRAFSAGLIPRLRHIRRVVTRETLAELNARFLEDPHLRQVFNRFATFNGSSPFFTPAAFAVIAYVQARFGAWHPRGGVAQIPAALHALATRLGVRFRFRTEVHDLTSLDADVVICNADAITAQARMLPYRGLARRMQRPAPSSSALVLFLALGRTFPELSHHNVLFSDDYDQEFTDIFQRRRPPAEPTIYIGISARADDRDAPAGCENWTVMVNVPADPTLEVRGYLQVVLKRLRRFGIDLQPTDILSQRLLAPRNFASRDNAWLGALYGWASHGPRAALLRPPVRHPRLRHLFFVGGTTHPGGGIPLVLRSGKIVAREVMRHFPLAVEHRR